MIENFLKALEITGAVKTIKRVLLVNGCKQYGVHLGQVKNPMLESDPWLDDPFWPPNFYYRQQDVLKAFCERHANVSWVVTYPNDVIGFATGNFMNMASGLGIYVAVTKELVRLDLHTKAFGDARPQILPALDVTIDDVESLVACSGFQRCPLAEACV